MKLVKKMKITGNEIAAFALAFVLSVAIHFIALAGIRGFSFPAATSANLFIASIVRETPPVMPTKGVMRGFDLKDSGREEDAAEGASQVEVGYEKEEIERPGESNSQADAEGVETVRGDDEGPQQNEEAERAVAKEKPVEDAVHRRDEKPVEVSRSFREKLNFDLYWLGVYVGRAMMEAVFRDNVVTIKTQAHSAAFISNFYKVEDYSESRIVDGRPVSFRIKQREGKYRSDKETKFDIGNKKVAYFDYLKDRRNEQEVASLRLWDVVSGFYYLRTQSLEVGKTVYIDVFDSDKFLVVEVSVLRKEKIEVPGKGEVSTVIVKPVLQSEGLFQKKGDMLIWLTDDGLKIPVRVETEVPVGKVVAILRGMETESGETSPKEM